MMPAAKHFDPMLGVDIHIIQPPGPVPPLPVPHPFVGIVFDPMDYVPILGATVMVNGVPRAQAGSSGEAMPKHIPIGGTFVKPPANEAEIFMGSMTVSADGDAFTYLALPVLTCHDVGMVTPSRPKKKKKVKSMVLPTTVVLPIPAGPPVLVGGAPTISLMALGMRIGMAALGRAFKKFKKKFKKWKKKKGKGKKPKKGKSKGNAPCGTDAHPVDVVTGACVDTIVDYQSPYGPLLRWTRYYDSSECDQAAPHGRGFRHEYERSLEADEDVFRYTSETGEEIEFPPYPEGADAVSIDGFVLRRINDTNYQVVEYCKPIMLFTFRSAGSPARLTRMDSGRHSLEFAYDAAGRLVQIKEGQKHRYRLDYTKAGNIERLAHVTDSPKGERATAILTYQYDAAGCLIAGTDALGHAFQYAYDRANRLTRLTDRNGYSFTYEFDASGRCSRTSGQDGLWGAEFQYEPDARITRVKYADGGTWVKEYNEDGIVISVTDPVGGVLTRTVDDDGRVVAEKDAAGRVTVFLYNQSGAHIGRRDHLGYFAPPYSEEPFPDDPLARRTPATAVEWQWGGLIDPARCGSDLLPAAERKLFPPELMQALSTGATVSPLSAPIRPSRSVHRKFDAMGRLIEETGGGTGGQAWGYDAEGRLVEHRNRNGATRHFRNSSWNLLAEETDPSGHKTSFKYSIRGELTGVTDPGGTLTEYQRDQKERITKVIRHGAVREQYRWDPADNLTEKLDAEGRPLVRFEIDKNGLVAARLLASGEVHKFKYDARGRVVLAENGPNKTTFAYNPRGDMIEDKQNGKGVAHKFVNRRLAETAVLGRFRTRYEWTDARHLVITDPLGGQHHCVRSPAGVVLLRLSNGTDEIARYGPGGKCLGKAARRPGGTGRLWRRQYRYSAEEELLEVHDSSAGVMTYRYDSSGRLTEESLPTGARHLIVYDAAGNILRKNGLSDATVTSGNRLGRAAGETFSYNARNHIAQSQGGDGQTVFEYDSCDLLVSFRSARLDWRAAYDPLGRRTTKEWAGRKVEFFWDQDRLAAEVFPNGVCRVYVYVDEKALVPFLFVDYETAEASPKKGTRYFIHTNQVGAPLRVEDDAGHRVWSATLDAYGTATVDPTSSIEFSLRFPGHYHDAELSLHYNRHRYYSPKLGRYLQSDPIGLAGGLNVYAYPANPLVKVDVIGLNCDGAPNKCKGQAEAPPKRKTAKKGDDLGELAKEAGMEKKHLEKLQQRSMDKGEIIIVRNTNPQSLPHHGTPGHVSKPVDCKFKTDKGDGLVKKPKEPMSPGDQKHFDELTGKPPEGKGWGTDADGNMLDPNGNKVYGDHDLQGVYEPTTHTDEFSGATHQGTHQVDTNDPNYRNGLNDDVCPENQMFNHGANDNYRDPSDPSKMGRTPGADESYTVTKPDGSVTQVNGTDELKKVYGENNIPWPY
jgi:RHS repeat-associated protein